MRLHFYLKNFIVLGFTCNECITVKNADSDAKISRLEFRSTHKSWVA